MNLTYQGKSLKHSQTALTIPNLIQLLQIKPYHIRNHSRSNNTLLHKSSQESSSTTSRSPHYMSQPSESLFASFHSQPLNTSPLLIIIQLHKS